MSVRFNASRGSIYDFSCDDVLIVCPVCSGRAVSRIHPRVSPRTWFSPRRLICEACAHTSEWAGRTIVHDGASARDDHFRLPLWLRTPCCGEVLWAYNERHLTYLEGLIGARLRGRRRDPKHGWSNRSLASRLPAWITSNKNREKVLKGLSRLGLML